MTGAVGAHAACNDEWDEVETEVPVEVKNKVLDEQMRAGSAAVALRRSAKHWDLSEEWQCLYKQSKLISGRGFRACRACG